MDIPPQDDIFPEIFQQCEIFKEASSGGFSNYFPSHLFSADNGFTYSSMVKMDKATTTFCTPKTRNRTRTTMQKEKNVKKKGHKPKGVSR